MKKRYSVSKALIKASFLFIVISICVSLVPSQSLGHGSSFPQRLLYGMASFYAEKFQGRATASGEKFSQIELTAACNVFPLGTWLKVTNLKNHKSIIVKTNDRLHPKTKRIIDLSTTGAKKLDYVSRGITRVKIEVINPESL